MKLNLIFIGIIFVILLIVMVGIFFQNFNKNQKNFLKEENMIPSKTRLNDKKVAMIIAFRNFRDEEYFIPKEILERGGAEIKTISNQKGTAIGANGGEAEVDFLVSEFNSQDFDAIIFVGGPGCLEALDNEDSYKICREAVSQNKILASICIAPVILAKAGVLEGKKATVWSSMLNKEPIKILEERGAIYENDNVVRDGKIITANGPQSAEKFGKIIFETLAEDN